MLVNLGSLNSGIGLQNLGFLDTLLNPLGDESRFEKNPYLEKKVTRHDFKIGNGTVKTLELQPYLDHFEFDMSDCEGTVDKVFEGINRPYYYYQVNFYALKKPKKTKCTGIIETKTAKHFVDFDIYIWGKTNSLTDGKFGSVVTYKSKWSDLSP